MATLRWVGAGLAGFIALAAGIGFAVEMVLGGGSDGGNADSRAQQAVTDPSARIAKFVAGLRPTDSYRAPTSRQRQLAVRGIETLLDHPARLDAADRAFAELGFTAATGTDPATGRRFAMYAGERGTARAWGVIFVDLSTPVGLAIEVPHPNSDLRTEQVGVRLFRRVPGSIMLVAGVHRDADNGAADVAHNEDSLFHVMATQFAMQGILQVQLHGFADRNLDGTDVVVSTGAAERAGAARRVADELEQAGFAICRAWRSSCGRLEGYTNVQGQAAERHRAAFIHLEMSYRVRRDESQQADLVYALAAANISGS